MTCFQQAVEVDPLLLFAISCFLISTYHTLLPGKVKYWDGFKTVSNMSPPITGSCSFALQTLKVSLSSLISLLSVYDDLMLLCLCKTASHCVCKMTSRCVWHLVSLEDDLMLCGVSCPVQMTVNSMSAFFMPPENLQLDELTNATLMKLEQFRDRTSTGELQLLTYSQTCIMNAAFSNPHAENTSSYRV